MALAASHVLVKNLTCLFFFGKNLDLVMEILYHKLNKIVDVFWFEVVIILLLLILYPVLEKLKQIFLPHLTVRAVKVVQYMLHLILNLAPELLTQVADN